MKKPTNKTTETKKEVPPITVKSFSILNARILEKSGSVCFDLVINDITIYGCFVRESETNGDFISFPQRKAENGKYYYYCYCKLSKEDNDKILAEVERVLNSK